MKPKSLPFSGFKTQPLKKRKNHHPCTCFFGAILSKRLPFSKELDQNDSTEVPIDFAAQATMHQRFHSMHAFAAALRYQVQGAVYCHHKFSSHLFALPAKAKPTNRQTDRQADRQTNKQTNKQTNQPTKQTRQKNKNKKNIKPNNGNKRDKNKREKQEKQQKQKNNQKTLGKTAEQTHETKNKQKTKR